MDADLLTEDPQASSEPGDEEATDGPSRWVIVAFVVALCLLTGAIGYWIAQPGEESFNAVDVGFLRDMTTHHSSAIGMSFDYLPREHDSLVGHFAREIIVTQSQEMAVMNGLATRAGNPKSVSDDIAMDWMGMAVPPAEMPGMPSTADSAKLRASTGLAADDQFTRVMIHHHAGGVAMAEYAAKHGENQAVRNLAASMAQVQRGEILEMNNQRAALGLERIDVTSELSSGAAHDSMPAAG